jgi:hypothetical protein
MKRTLSTGAALAALTWLLVAASAPAAGNRPFTVKTTLDGKTILPHRIHWYANPTLAPAKVKEVDFLVDGKRLWVEHHAPYAFADDGNYLVTSFLAPGKHRFEVKAVSTAGTTATDVVTAIVSPAPAPPAALAGTWTAHRGAAPGGNPRAGTWRLVISSVGWRIYDTEETGNLLDVIYPSSGLARVQTGMASGHPKFDLNGFCDGAPGSPVKFRWSVASNSLTFAFAGGKPCPGFEEFLTGSAWRKAG